MKNTVYYFLLVLSLSSCTPIVRYNSFDSTQRISKTENLEIFTSVNSIPYNYKEIGLITVDDEGWGRSENELMNIAINKGKEVGADGLLVLAQDNSSAGYVLTGNIATAYNRKVVRISAIVKTSEKNNVNAINTDEIHNKLLKLKELKDKGVITEDEFNTQKAKLLEKL